MNIAIFVLCFVIGLLIGYIFGNGSNRSDGLLIIDDCGEETTKWTLDVKTDPNKIPNKKEIRLRVFKMDKRSCE